MSKVFYLLSGINLMIGVLGGMGPAATVDFLEKLVAYTDAEKDQDHIPVVVVNDPRIPDRTEAILARGTSPLPKLLSLINQIEIFNPELIVIPCNSAHYWFNELTDRSRAPVISIVEATITEIRATASLKDRIGVLATSGTLCAKLYDRALVDAGYRVEVLNDIEQERIVSKGIALIKSGDTKLARALFDKALQQLTELGCTHVILGCTEISIVLGRSSKIRGLTLVDSNTALAKMAIRRVGRKLRIPTHL